MSRRRAAIKREVLPDAKYKDKVITKFMNRVMFSGKKSTAEKIVYGAFDIINKKTKNDPLEYFHEAIDKVKPGLEVRSRRVGGATYQVPVEVRPIRAQALAMKWLIENAKKPHYKMIANIVPYDEEIKNIVKKRRYRYNPDDRSWSTIFNSSEKVEKEKLWLTENIYNGFFKGTIILINVFDKYKDLGH